MLKSGEVQVLGHEVDVGSFEHSVDEWEHESQDVELEQSQDDKEALQNKWAALNALPSEDALMTEVEAERIRKSVDDSANKKEKRQRFTTAAEWAKLCNTPIYTKVRYYEEPKPSRWWDKLFCGWGFESCLPSKNGVRLEIPNKTQVVNEKGEQVIYDGKRSNLKVYYRDYQAEKARNMSERNISERHSTVSAEEKEEYF
eukprot:Selendium_serpulae@DN6519_c2_g1_i5.p1